MLIQASGLLNNYKMPNIDGIEKFKGRIVHTAAWPKDFQAEQWKENRMAIIGSGSSSLQTVATMQPHAKHMDIFVRTGVWFISLGDNTGANVCASSCNCQLQLTSIGRKTTATRRRRS